MTYMQAQMDARKEGRMEGRMEGRIEGRKEGEDKRSREIAVSMHEAGFGTDMIAKLLKCSEKDAADWIGIPAANS